MVTRTIRDFGKIADAISVPNLIEVQLNSYGRFLQAEISRRKEKISDLKRLFREIFPSRATTRL